VHGKIHIPFIVKRQAQENTVNFTYLCEEFSTRTHSEIQINLWRVQYKGSQWTWQI